MIDTADFYDWWKRVDAMVIEEARKRLRAIADLKAVETDPRPIFPFTEKMKEWADREAIGEATIRVCDVLPTSAWTDSPIIFEDEVYPDADQPTIVDKK